MVEGVCFLSGNKCSSDRCPLNTGRFMWLDDVEELKKHVICIDQSLHNFAGWQVGTEDCYMKLQKLVGDIVTGIHEKEMAELARPNKRSRLEEQAEATREVAAVPSSASQYISDEPDVVVRNLLV